MEEEQEEDEEESNIIDDYGDDMDGIQYDDLVLF